MKPELKAKWTEALRSGKYTQGENYLCRGGAYCCLGVLCEVAGKEWVVDESEPSAKGIFVEREYASYVNIHTLSHELEAEFDIDYKKTSDLMNMNDEEGKTFSEIADWIDGNL